MAFRRRDCWRALQDLKQLYAVLRSTLHDRVQAARWIFSYQRTKGQLMHPDIYECKVCEEETEFAYIEAERGDRFQPGWDACLKCTVCDDFIIEMWELENE